MSICQVQHTALHS